MNVRNAKHNHKKNKALNVNVSLRKKHKTKFFLRYINFAFKFDKSSFINASFALLSKIKR